MSKIIKNMNEQKKKKIRTIMMVVFFAAMIIITVVLIPVIMMLRTTEGRQQLSETVKSYGPFASLMFIGMQILNIVVAFIPGEPIEIMGGIMFGIVGGLILCLAGVLIGTIIVFYLVKLFGKPLVEVFASSERISKIKILNDEKRLETLVFLLFLIPGTPKDVLTYIVPMTRIKPSKYFIYTTIARIPSIVTSTMVGANFGKGNIFMGIVIMLITAAIGLVGILYKDNITDKFKNKKEKK